MPGLAKTLKTSSYDEDLDRPLKGTNEFARALKRKRFTIDRLVAGGHLDVTKKGRHWYSTKRRLLNSFDQAS
jgi:hypothetical protein